MSILQTAPAFRDPARLVEVYHEISHLWNVPLKDRASPRWYEGLAQSLQFLAADELDGTSRLPGALEAARAWLREHLRALSDHRDVPMIRYGTARLTGLSCQVGMLMFDELYGCAGGDAFNEIIGGFHREYAQSGATTEQFVRFAEKVAGRETRILFDRWMITTARIRECLDLA
jgi:hypothetical protein